MSVSSTLTDDTAAPSTSQASQWRRSCEPIACRVDPEFDSRHDLSLLLIASGLPNYVPEKRRQEVAAALGYVWARWRNDYRYTSDDRLLSELRGRNLTIGIKGDQDAQLKENSRRAFENAHYLVGMGVARWNVND